jgi:hypothetical protein
LFRRTGNRNFAYPIPAKYSADFPSGFSLNSMNFFAPVRFARRK